MRSAAAADTLQEERRRTLSQAAVERTERKPVSVPMQAPGSAFFALMAGLWGSFVTLLAVSPETLDDAYDWLRGLALVPEIVMWILTLPWTVAYLVYETSWQHWVRVALVAIIVTVHLGACAPRARGKQTV
jgi:hypothetical protein